MNSKNGPNTAVKREVSDIIEKTLKVSRCTKVTKGGRKFRFAVLSVAGNKKGFVGIGLGKALDVSDAKSKAAANARKAMFKVPLKARRTLHYDVKGRFGAGKVVLRSAPVGTGIIAGGPVRSLCELLGIKDIVVKSVGTANSHNMVKAAVAALKSIVSPSYIAEKRGLKISELYQKSGVMLKDEIDFEYENSSESLVEYKKSQSKDAELQSAKDQSNCKDGE